MALATVTLCSLSYQVDTGQLLAIACTVLLIGETLALAVQRSRQVSAWRSRAVVLLALAAFFSALLTIWLIGQQAYYISAIAPQAICTGRYDPQRIVPAFDAAVNAYALAGATLGAILALFGLGTLFAFVSLLTYRGAQAQPSEATRPAVS
ncbi:MAG TPA: hypothetical protein VH393_03475 [Ktedonobacterales bacterium]|jgi:hypothetical protein